jgi:hypothetical protein
VAPRKYSIVVPRPKPEVPLVARGATTLSQLEYNHCATINEGWW